MTLQFYVLCRQAVPRLKLGGGGQDVLDQACGHPRKAHFVRATLRLDQNGWFAQGDPVISPGFGGADTKFRCPMAITARRWRMLLASCHCSINHGRFQVAQVYKQAIQVLEEIYESCIMRIVDLQIMAEATLNKYVREIPKPRKPRKVNFSTSKRRMS